MGHPDPIERVSRRWLLGAAGAALAGGFGARAAWAVGEVDPILAGRPLARYPEKTDLIVLTARPPQLETPMSYFAMAITPNEAFFVRYHMIGFPTQVDLLGWRLQVNGHVDHPLALSMADLQTKFPKVSVTAVAQCSGNSRGRFSPRVPGGQWGDGAMGNAVWSGARLKDILTAAGLRQGAVDVTFDGLDRPPASMPDFVKALGADRIMNDPDVIVAYEMNGQRLPMLNGFPARLIVPGWYATYWVKNLSLITVLTQTFETFWMKPAYRIPDTPCGCVEPGTTPAQTVPIQGMTVRSFMATPASGKRVALGQPVALKGIAFDGGTGIRQVLISDDGGKSWRAASLGEDLGRFSFREWSATWTPRRPGAARLMVRAVNGAGQSQDPKPLWNPAGYLRNVIEQVTLVVA